MIKIVYGSFFGPGFPEVSLDHAVDFDPDIVVVQGTTQDGGPYYQCTGESEYSTLTDKNILGQMVELVVEHDYPFIFSLGYGGSDVGLETQLELLDEITRERGYGLTTEVISGELDKEWLIDRLEDGTVASRLIETERFSERVTPDQVRESCNVVAQMGPERIVEAWERIGSGEVDGIITGRSLDTGLVMVYPLYEGYDRDLAAHFGKCMELGGQANRPILDEDGEPISPRGIAHDLVSGELYEDHFRMRPLNPALKTDPQSVAEVTLYERENPFEQLMPGGALNLRNAEYYEHDSRTTRGHGATFEERPYTLKIEGGQKVGQKAMSYVGIRDPGVIQNVDLLKQSTREEVEEVFNDQEFRLHFKTWGVDAVMGPLEPNTETEAHELCLMIETLAETTELAKQVNASANRLCRYRRELEPRGAFGTATGTHSGSPQIIDLGPHFEWSIWHELPVSDPIEPFDGQTVSFPRSSDAIPFTEVV